MLLVYGLLLLSVQIVLQARQCYGFTLSWGRNTHRTCSPINMLCTHTEQCCSGVCVHRIYIYVIKVKQCTMLDHLELMSPEEQLTYLQSEAVRDNLTRLGGRLKMVQNPEDIDPSHPLSLITLNDGEDITNNGEVKV
ncbi:uncharacterized protein LOC129004862 [Macrosteles quadrilineatus]|uniref:uncharacterized protein LOC129004862 n=1 Tax=Macrosteles quadrilineatus TaxID=74068 RepID=UPI0023E22EA4|nr:uncharacterized protein LOC129004862 [Macrosteles quadrilineatus]